MAGMNMLQIIKSIPKFDGLTFIVNGSFNDILQISWPFLSKIISGTERFIPRSGGWEGMENGSDFDDNDSNPINSEVSGHDSGNLDKKSHNGDDMKTWDSAMSICSAF